MRYGKHISEGVTFTKNSKYEFKWHQVSQMLIQYIYLDFNNQGKKVPQKLRERHLLKKVSRLYNEVKQIYMQYDPLKSLSE